VIMLIIIGDHVSITRKLTSTVANYRTWKSEYIFNIALYYCTGTAAKVARRLKKAVNRIVD